MASQAKTDQQSEIRPAQSRMARGALGWGIRELGKAAGVSHDTIVRFERGDELRERTIEAIRSAFDAAGIVFIPENGGGPGVRLRKRSKR
jgi:transcriptional regulator with XRE-family HTH domain